MTPLIGQLLNLVVRSSVADRIKNNHPTKSISFPGFCLKRLSLPLLDSVHHSMATQIAGGGSTNAAFRVRKFVCLKHARLIIL